MGEQQSTEGVPTDRREKVAWYLFDFANTSFTVLIVTALFPLYFRTLVGDPLLGDTLWGYAGSITMLIIAVTSPVLLVPRGVVLQQFAAGNRDKEKAMG